LRIAAPGRAPQKLAVSISAGEEHDLGTVVLEAGSSLAGHVIDDVSNEPVVAARVAIAIPGGDSADTDERGGFLVSGVSPSEAMTTLHVSANGYADREVSVATQPDANTDSDVTVRLQRPGVLVVRAWSEERGDACDGCRITIGDSAGFHGGIANAAGEARFEGLSPGRYQVNREETQATGTSVYVHGGRVQFATVRSGDTTYVEIGSPGSTLTVQVSPEPGADWLLSASDRSGSADAQPIGGGTWTLRLHRDGPLTLALSRGDEGVVIGTVPDDFHGAVAPIRLPANAIRATLTREHRPLALSRVMLYAMDGSVRAWATTSPAGSVIFDYIAPGAYRLGSAPIVVRDATSELGSVEMP